MRFFNVFGALQKARRSVSKPASVSSEEVKDPLKLAEMLRQLSVRVQELEAQLPSEAVEFEVNVTSGTTLRLNHNLGVPVRWYVTHWKTSESSTSAFTTTAENVVENYQNNSPIVARAAGLNFPWNSVAGGSAQGCRYRMKTVRPIVGVRFGWQSAGGARTVTCRIWNDTTGLSLANVDVSVNNSGIYNAMFATPITTDLTGTDITASCYNNANFTTTNDVSWKSLNIELNDNLRLVQNSLTVAGDARPDVVHGAVVSCIVEPILAVSDTWSGSVPNPTCPELSFNPSSTLDTLVLDSYSTGRAVIRIEPSQAGLN